MSDNQIIKNCENKNSLQFDRQKERKKLFKEKTMLNFNFSNSG